MNITSIELYWVIDLVVLHDRYGFVNSGNTTNQKISNH